MTGHEVIATLAKRFPQLYIAPAEDTLEAYKLAAGRGVAPEDKSLNHFITSERDELRTVETPAGPVEVVYLANRQDFETFLQIIGNKAQPVPILRSVGAITYSGLPDWGEVARQREEYIANGGTNWPAEFSRRAKVKGAFRIEIVIISEGPYSNVSAEHTPYDSDTWLNVSREIRLHHECAHVVCRRTMPDDILPVWDEVTADVVGLLCATQHYDANLAMLFFDKRIAEYLNEEQAKRTDEILAELRDVCTRIEAQVGEEQVAHPFDFLLELKRAPLLTY